MSNSITRRSFLKGSAIAALAAALPNMRAVAEEKTYTYADTIAWDGEYDVVVIGFGGAGAVAANFAAKTSDSVLIFDVAPKGHEGGNTRYSGQFVVCGDNKDDLMTYYKALDHGGDSDEEMLKVVIEKLTTLGDDMNAEYNLPELMYWRGIPSTAWAIPEYPELPGSSTINAFSVHAGAGDGALWNVLRQKVVDQPEKIDILYETRGRKLIQDPETKTILGVSMERGGEMINIRAKNGVVMAMGGFENNPQMLKNYLYLSHSNPGGTLYNRGDGITMALEVNADLWHMNLLNSTGRFAGLTLDVGEGKLAVTASGFDQGGSFIVVGTDGSRYMNETVYSRHGYVYYCGEYKIPLHPEVSYIIMDEKMMQSLRDNNAVSEEMLSVMTEADSYEALAEKLGMSRLVKHVELFNSCVAAGDDHMFDRDPATMIAMDDGKCYAVRMALRILNTQGGARRNARAEVLDVNGNPIPHLYSAGEFGGMTAKNYQGATNLAECLIMGRIAGENAAIAKEALPAYKVRESVESNIKYTLGTSDEVAATYTSTENEYIGKGTGIGGDVVVKCTIENGEVKAVEVLQQTETEGIGTPAIENLPAKFVGCKTADDVNGVDAIGGATITSKALKAAVIDCLTQAAAK